MPNNISRRFSSGPLFSLDFHFKAFLVKVKQVIFVSTNALSILNLNELYKLISPEIAAKMFSNEINTRDLYFNNPVDHFLGPECDIKTSYESGFNSTFNGFNHSGNSMEKQYKNSQDLFSQTQKSDITESQFGTCNTDYQKYISQNLLLGKGDRSPKSILSSQQNDQEKKKEQITQNEISKILLKELKESISFLSDCAKRFNNAEQNDATTQKLAEVISKLDNKLSAIDTSFEKCLEKVNENCRLISKSQREDNSSTKNICALVTEIRDAIENLQCMFENNMENNGHKVVENVKKIIKRNEYINKEKLEGIQEVLSKIDETVVKLITSNEVLLKVIETRIEKKIDEKFNDIKGYIANSLPRIQTTTQVTPIRVYTSQLQRPNQDIPERFCESRGNIYKNNYDNPPRLPQLNQQLSYQNNTRFQKFSNTTQTPLIKYVNEIKNATKQKPNPYLTRSRAKAKEEKYNIKSQCSNLRVRRKISTPNGISSPAARDMIQKQRTTYCTPLVRSLENNTFYNPSTDTKQKVQCSKPQYQFSSQLEFSMNSSPGLTVCEATTLARQYSVHTRHLQK